MPIKSTFILTFFFINTMFNKINGKELLIIFWLRLNISLVKDSKAILADLCISNLLDSRS